MYHLAANLGSDEMMPRIPGELLVKAFITSEEDDQTLMEPRQFERT